MADLDLIQAIRQDHQEVKSLLDEIAAHPDPDTFDELSRKIVIHETTEQELVHPLVAGLPGGQPVVTARLEEETEGSSALEKLRVMGVDDPGFGSAFAEFRRAVLAHAEHEERDEHPKLMKSVDPERLARLGEIYRTEEDSRIEAST